MARAWRLLLAALAAARPVAGAHEKYVIQAYDPAHVDKIDAKPPDGFSTIELTAGTNASTKVSYSVARNGRRKGVAQMTRMRPMEVHGRHPAADARAASERERHGARRDRRRRASRRQRGARRRRVSCVVLR